MPKTASFYIDGAWEAPADHPMLAVENPADRTVTAHIAHGQAWDIDRAVQAAHRAFTSWQASHKDDRIALLQALGQAYQKRADAFAEAVSQEMGAPIDLARHSHVPKGLQHIETFVDVLKTFSFEAPLHPNQPSQWVRHEPVGVAGLITPWNWPLNQISIKVAAALAAGCTMVLKPSEIAPLSALLFAECMEEAGVPAGVFNLVTGDGTGTGAALAAHEGVDMVSFTGSTRAGRAIGAICGGQIKRTALELGGKSANLVFADADLEEAVSRGVRFCFNNSGQSCNNASRMLVERSVYQRALAIASETAAHVQIGHPAQPGAHIGPLASRAQYERVQAFIQSGLDEGARLLVGGLGHPAGFDAGYYVRPTIFADAHNDMQIAREEIFGPVLAIIPFEDEEEAIALANDSPYGLAAYIQSGDAARIARVSRCLRAGTIQVNGARRAPDGPFGGYKQSGLGREGGMWGLLDFLEVKSMSGADFI